MNLDHTKFVELLADAVGIKKENAEKQLAELVAEIKQAIGEGEAYEIEEFGIFSGIGNKIIFIPSEELATEINYKYVGMEPIELSDSPAVDEKEEEVATETVDEEFEDDPFAGLLDEEEQNETGIDEAESPFEEEHAPEDIFGLSSDKDADEEPSDEGLNSDEIQEEKPGPEKWGIDSYKDDDAENTFAGMLDDNDGWDVEAESKSSEKETDSGLPNDVDSTVSRTKEDRDEEKEPLRILLDTNSETNDEVEGDFKNPFEDLDEEGNETAEEKDEVVPVITNISSDVAEKKPKEKRRDTTKRRSYANQRQNKSAFLYVLLAFVLIGGGIFALGYFNVIDIPGISSQTTATQMAGGPPVATETFVDEIDPDGEEAEAQSTSENQNTIEDPADASTDEEQSPEAVVSETEDAVPAPDQPQFGLQGAPVPEANAGYTIVLFSFSNEGNIQEQQQKLSDMGYRVLVSEIPSSQYGSLWRVSIGQFQTLRDAAIASESLEEPYSNSYFITEIQ